MKTQMKLFRNFEDARYPCEIGRFRRVLSNAAIRVARNDRLLRLHVRPNVHDGPIKMHSFPVQQCRRCPSCSLHG